MKLTTEQLAVLNHIVVDGQTWADNATEEHMLAKVARWEVDYETALAKGDYKTRKQRDDVDAQRVQDERDNVSYAVKRKREYPNLAEYLDGIVKNDQDQIDKYIADCKTVKDKYPKA